VVLLVVGERAEVSLNGLVEALGLAVRLWVEGRGHPGADAGESEELFPHIGGEAGVPVQHYIRWQPVVPPDLAGEDFRKVACRLTVFQKREEMRHLGKSVDDYPELVASVGDR